MNKCSWVEMVADEVFADIHADMCRCLRRCRSGQEMASCIQLVIPDDMSFFYYDTKDSSFRLSEIGTEVVRKVLSRCQEVGIVLTACVACCDLGKGLSLDIPLGSRLPCILRGWCRKWWKERARVCIRWETDAYRVY